MDFSFDETYLTYRDQLWRFAYSFLKNAASAEDVVQDVFVSLWERRDEVDVKHSLKVWLYAAVRNRCLNVLRHDEVVDNAPEYSVSYPESALDEMERAELKALIDKAITEMPPRRRAMFELRYREELTLAEVAEVFGVSTAAVHKAVMAAEDGLRPLLARYYHRG